MLELTGGRRRGGGELSRLESRLWGSVLAALLSFVLGCGEPAGGPVVFRPPELPALDRLLLRYTGPSRAPIRVTVERAGAPPYVRMVDLGEGSQVSKEAFALEVPLEVPVLERSRVLVAPGEGAGTEVAGTSGEVDPTRLVRELMAPVTSLDGERLATFLRRVDDVRLAFARDAPKGRFEAELAARRALAAHFSAAGLPPAVLRRVAAVLPRKAWGTFSVGSPLYRAVEPLMALESALADQAGLRPPWEPLQGVFGTVFHASYRRMSLKGWTVVASRNCVEKIVDPTGIEATIERWLWMAPPRFVGAPGEDRAGVIGFAVENLLPRRGAKGATPEEGYPSVLEVPFTLRGDEFPTWPPGVVLFEMVVRNLDRANRLQLTLNDAPPVTLVNGLYLSESRSDVFQLDAFCCYVPLDSTRLVRGLNRVTLRVFEMPHARAALPFQVREVAVRCAPSPRELMP